MKVLGIKEETSLVELEKCVALLKKQLPNPVPSSMTNWSKLFERVEAYIKDEPLWLDGRNAVMYYVETLNKYLIFLQDLPCLKEETALRQAIDQTEFLKKIIPHVTDERLIDLISEHSNFIAIFAHTETVLAYLMFSSKEDEEISAYKKLLLRLYESSNFLMFSHRDMCRICEKTWSFFANERKKQVVVLSNKEHEDSHLRHNEGSLLKKIPLGSDMHMAWKTIKRDPKDKKWREIFLYNFSPRMISLLGMCSNLVDIIKSDVSIIPEEANMAKDIFLFDRLIDDSSVIIRASEIYNCCIREYFFGKKDIIIISPYVRQQFLKELPAMFQAFFN